MTSTNAETTKEIIIEELLDFRRFHVDVEYIKNLLQWWEKHESKFPKVSFFARQILGIVGSQIEIECIFSLVGILTSLRRYKLQLKF
jgi:hypothetical protein